MSRLSMTQATAFAGGCAGVAAVANALSAAAFLPPAVQAVCIGLSGAATAAGASVVVRTAASQKSRQIAEIRVVGPCAYVI
jgi:hypothetical protein